MLIRQAGVAQWPEQLIRNQQVVGSTPIPGSTDRIDILPSSLLDSGETNLSRCGLRAEFSADVMRWGPEAEAMNVNDLLKEKREEILQIAARHGARNVRIFGSVVRGEADAASDIDLLVTLEPGTTLLDHAALILELEDLLGCKVDVASDRGLRPRVKERVMSEATPL
jgi:uncharacterized protein